MLRRFGDITRELKEDVLFKADKIGGTVSMRGVPLRVGYSNVIRTPPRRQFSSTRRPYSIRSAL